MNRKQQCLLIVFIFLSGISFGQVNSKKTYSFSLISNRIIVHVPYQKKMLNFIFDTGSNYSFIDSLSAKQFNFPFLKKARIKMVKGIKHVHLTRHEGLTEISSSIWAITQLNYQTMYLGYQIDGLLGASALVKNGIVEIDFHKKKIHINYKLGNVNKKFRTVNLVANNCSEEGLARFFPKYPSISEILNFRSDQNHKTNLIIDTGCQFEFAFLTNDSILIRNYTTKIGKYISIDGKNSSISFGKVCLKNNYVTTCVEAPFFYNSSMTSVINNKFYGLLGVPFLKKFDRVIIDWPRRKIYFSKK